MSRRWLDPESAADIGKLDPEAIARVREEAWPDARDADELHDALLWLTFMTDEEVQRNAAWPALLQRADDAAARDARARQARGAASVRRGRTTGPASAQRAVRGRRDRRSRDRRACAARRRPGPAKKRCVEIVRGRLEGLGPDDRATALAASLGVTTRRTSTPALLALEAEGFAMRGQFEVAAEPHGGDRSGAIAACSRAFIATPSSGCAPRSSRCRRATSCASCSMAARRRRRRACRARTPCRPCSRSSKASMRRPARGKPKSCRRASPSTNPPGSTSSASPAASSGRGSRRARRCRARRGAGARRRRSRCCRDATCASGRALDAAAERTQLTREGAAGRRLHPGARRVVLRRDRRAAPACCRTRSKKRSASWSRSAS